MNQDRCLIENPLGCLGYRCHVFGICDHNRRLDGRPLCYSQERLGKEFEEVLYANLWELYTR